MTPHTLSRRGLLGAAASTAGALAVLSACAGTASVGTSSASAPATGSSLVSGSASRAASGSATVSISAASTATTSAATAETTSASVTGSAPAATTASTSSFASSTVSGSGTGAAGVAVSGTLSVVWASSGTAIDHTNFAKLWAAFEASQPKVKVQATEYPFNTFTDKMTTLFAAGEPPDVLYVNTSWVADFAGRQLLAPLDSYLAQDTSAPRSDFYPASLQAYTWKGVLVGLPWIATPHVFYYNRDLFQRAGATAPSATWTYDAFLKAAQALTSAQAATPRYGYTGTPLGLAWIAGPIWQYGGDIFDDSLTHCVLNGTGALGALQFDADLTTRYAVVPPASATTASVNAGNVAMTLSIPASARQWTQVTNSLGTALPPNGTAGEITTFACNAFGIAKGAKMAASAWDLTVFTTGDTAQQLIQGSRGGVPPRSSVASAPALSSVYQPWEDPKAYQAALQHARALPQPSQFTQVDTAFQKAWKDVLAGKNDVKTAMQAVTQQANGLLAAAS